MKNKRILFIFIIAFALILLCSTKVDATLELEQLDFDAQINEDGSMDVTEIWDIYISDTNTLFKTFKKDNSKYSKITDVEVTEITDGSNKKFTQINQEMYHVTKNCYYALNNSKGMFEIAWGVGLDDDSDTRQYQVSYKVVDAIAKYNDYAEIYWQFIGDEFEISADKIDGTIILPHNAESKEDIRVWGHTEDLNGEIYVTDLNKIEFTINRYSSGNYVEVRSLFPNDMIASTGRQYNHNILDNVLQEETKWAEKANARRERQKNMAYCVAGIVGLITIFFAYKAFKNILKLRKLEKKFKPSTKLQYFRELPYEDATPAEALFVMSTGMNKSFSSSFSANILDLCLNKYISLEVVGNGGIIKSSIVKITLLDKDSSRLKEDEKLTLEFLQEVAGNDKELTTKDITKYLEKHVSKVDKLNNKLEKIIETEEIQKGNYNKENYKKMNNYGGIVAVYTLFAIFSFLLIIFFVAVMSTTLVPIAILLIAILTINAIVLGMMSYKVNVFSQKGVDEKEQWKAFKKYMEDFSLLKEKEVPALVVWEKYLVFATAFGISEKVLKQLKVIYPEITDMNSAMYSYSYIHIMNSVNIGDCINNSVYSAVGSSGSGAGGGFSGGGGGGRWPEVAVADAKRKRVRQVNCLTSYLEATHKQFPNSHEKQDEQNRVYNYAKPVYLLKKKKLHIKYHQAEDDQLQTYEHEFDEYDLFLKNI